MFRIDVSHHVLKIKLSVIHNWIKYDFCKTYIWKSFKCIMWHLCNMPRVSRKHVCPVYPCKCHGMDFERVSQTYTHKWRCEITALWAVKFMGDVLSHWSWLSPTFPVICNVSVPFTQISISKWHNENQYCWLAALKLWLTAHPALGVAGESEILLICPILIFP